MKIKTRSLWTIILSAFCAVLLACSIGLYSGISSRAQTTADLADSSKTLRIGELTQKGYNSSTNPNAVFDRDNLTALYSALTGGTGTTLQAVANTVTGTHSTQYGNKVKTYLPEYKSALDLYTLNSNRNIVVNFGGQEWEVSFLTTDNNGDVIATLWMTQPLKDSSGTTIKSQFGWATNDYTSTGHTATAVKYISNAYATSKLRMTVLNGGDPDGSATQYAWDTSNASPTSLTGAVSSNERKSNVLSAFTLNNSALTGTANANKSLINYITQPFDVEYTYRLDWSYADGGVSTNGYFMNDALTRDASGAAVTDKLSTGAGSTNTSINGGTGKYQGEWYSLGVKNYAYSAVTHYNDWGADYVWIPSISEVGRKYSDAATASQGLWETYANATDQVKFNNGSLNYDSTQPLSASTNSAEYVWSRSSSPTCAFYAQFWSSSSVSGYGFTAASMGIRPALHLNLTAADESSCLKASDITTTKAYDNATDKPVTYNGSQHTLAYLKPDWYTNLSKYYTDSDRVELTYEFIKQGDTTTTFDTPALGKDGITTSLKVDPTVVTNLVDAGKYKITIKLKDSSLFWEDDDLDYDTASAQEKELARYKVVKFEIKQAEIKYKWQNIGLDSSWKAAFAQNFTPATGTSAAPWVYLNYTLPVPADNTATPSATTTKIPYVVLKFTGSDAQFGDNIIDNIDNVRGGTSKGSNYPKHADTYTVSFVDKNKDTSNYKLVADTGENTTRSYTITRMLVTAPAAMQAKDYTGAEQSFSPVNGYSKLSMTYGTLDTDGLTYLKEVLPKDDEGNDLFTVNESGNDISLAATNAGKYKLHYRLLTETNTAGNEVVRDYKWSDASDTDPAPVKFVEYEIKPVTLEFNFTSSASGGSWTIKSNDETSKLTYDYATGKGPVAGETPVIEIWYYYNSDGESSVKKYSDSDMELLFKDLLDLNGKHETGKYTVVLKLADSDVNTVNKNYALKADDSNPAAALATYTKELTISAAEASLDDIKTVYKSSLMGASDDPVELPEKPDNLKYAYDEAKKAAVEYLFTLDFSAVDYLQVVGVYTYKYSDGSTTSSFTKADTVTVTVNIEVKSDKRASNKLPAKSDYTGTKFIYEPDTADSDGNIYTATLSFTYEIGRAEVDLSKVEYEYGYMNDDGKIEYVATYDPKNPPEFKDLSVYVRVKKPLPLGIDDATVSDKKYTGTRNSPGEVGFEIEYTLNSNYCYKNDSGDTITTPTFTKNDKITLAKKKINVSWTITDYVDADSNPVKDDNGLPYQIYVFNGDPDLKQFIKYEYYYADTTDITNPVVSGKVAGDGNTALDYLINTDGAGKLNSEGTAVNSLPIFIRMVIDDSVKGSEKYELSFENTDDYVFINLGEPKIRVFVKVLKDSSVYLTDIKSTEIFELRKESETGEEFSKCANVYIYPEGKPDEKVAIADFDFVKANAGKYVVKLELKAAYKDDYALTDTDFTFTVKPVELVVPTLKDGASFTYNGEEQKLLGSLENFNETYMEFAQNSIHEAKNAGTYSVVINIKAEYAGNYIFALPKKTDTPVKAVVKYALADDAAEPELSADKSTAIFKWTIDKFVIDTTGKNAWNFGKNGATLNLPNWVKALTTGAEPSLVIETLYYDVEGTPLAEYELKGGNKFLVAAYVDPSCADAGNFEFKDQKADVAGVIASPQASYTVPKSGAAALLGNVKDFVSNKLWGLPIWAWLAIALALILLLIIIIAVCVKRRKTKEQREEIKARKEEEKQRREEERRMQQKRLEAERELARAKQEAELEKIRAQAGMAGAGMASMAMAQPAQQQMPMSAQQQQPVQQQMPAYGQPSGDMAAVLAKIEAELAQIRAEQNASRGYSSAPVYGPQPMGDMNAILMAKMEAEFAKMQAKQEASQEVNAAKMELEFFKLHGVPMTYGYNQIAQQSGKPVMDMPNGAQGNYSAEEVGAIMAAMMRNMGVNPSDIGAQKPAELPQVTEESKNSASATYPPDAVITTTTTVDTTKKVSDSHTVRSEQSDDGRMFDIDGFYDNFESK